MKTKSVLLKITIVAIGIFIIGLILPQNLIQPVENATKADYHPNSFWFYPWGTSGTHKGVDIFAKTGTPVLAATSGFVINCGNIKKGGNYVLLLGPKWRFTYYAHLKEIKTKRWHFVKKGKEIGSVGTSGNAAGKPPHLHFTLFTAIPYPWRIDKSPQGWKKMFFLNPITYFEK